MTLLELVNRLKLESGRSGGPLTDVAIATGNDARLVAWIRTAWEQIQNDRTWKWMRTVGEGQIVDGQSVYPPATFNAAGLRGWVVDDEAYQPSCVPEGQTEPVTWLRQIGYQRARSLFLRVPHQPAAPQYWAQADNLDLVVVPTPAGNWDLTIDFWAGNTNLTANDDTPPMPARFHLILVWKALMEVAAYDNSPEVYTRAKANFEEMWGALKDDQDIPMTVRPLRMG